MLKKKAHSGITLIELLLVITIIAILGATVVPVSTNLLQRHFLKNKTNELVNSLSTARLNAMLSKEDSQWGVKTTSTQMILFKGSSYAGRDTAFDLVYDLPATISVTEIEVVFSKLTGDPSQTLSVTVSSQIDSKTITMNAVGVVNVN